MYECVRFNCLGFLSLAKDKDISLTLMLIQEGKIVTSDPTTMSLSGEFWKPNALQIVRSQNQAIGIL